MEDHPGGDEVLLAATGNLSTTHIIVAAIKHNKIGSWNGWHITGKDATNDFEDVGHSDSAREMMDKYYIGEIDPATVPLKRTYSPPKRDAYNADKTPDFVIKMLQLLVPLLILGLAFAVRHYTKEKLS